MDLLMLTAEHSQLFVRLFVLGEVCVVAI